MRVRSSPKWVLLLTLLLTACHFEGVEISDEERNQIITCIDERDGYTFTFNTNTVYNYVVGSGGYFHYEITTLDGEDMVISSDIETFMECTKNGG